MFRAQNKAPRNIVAKIRKKMKDSIVFSSSNGSLINLEVEVENISSGWGGGRVKNKVGC